MNSFKRKALFTAVLAGLALSVSACSLNPKQLQALDGAVCNKAKAGEVDFTTTAIGGASKSQGISIDGSTCSITSVGKP